MWLKPRRAGVSVWLNGDRTVVDAFYTPPAEVPATPGVLLRVEGFDASVPDSADAWRILYTTTREDGVPAVATVMSMAVSGPSTPRSPESRPRL